MPKAVGRGCCYSAYGSELITIHYCIQKSLKLGRETVSQVLAHLICRILVKKTNVVVEVPSFVL